MKMMAEASVFHQFLYIFGIYDCRLQRTESDSEISQQIVESRNYDLNSPKAAVRGFRILLAKAVFTSVQRSIYACEDQFLKTFIYQSTGLFDYLFRVSASDFSSGKGDETISAESVAAS